MTLLKKAREKNSLGNSSIMNEIMDFLMSKKSPVSPVEIAENLAVTSKVVRNKMQKKLNLAKGKKAELNSGIIEIKGKGFVRLTKVNKAESKDGSINRYEFSKSIKKAWLS